MERRPAGINPVRFKDVPRGDPDPFRPHLVRFLRRETNLWTAYNFFGGGIDCRRYRFGLLFPYILFIQGHHAMTSMRDTRIDGYIEKLPVWQQEICNKVRTLVHGADPEVSETVKRTERPYFTLQGNICALLATKDHVNIFIYDPIAPDPESIINQGHENKSARSIQVYEGDRMNEPALLNLFKAVIANNRAGGWRRLKP